MCPYSTLINWNKYDNSKSDEKCIWLLSVSSFDHHKNTVWYVIIYWAIINYVFYLEMFNLTVKCFACCNDL